MTGKLLTAIGLSMVAGALSAESIARIYRPARVTRGNTNILKVQPIDDACWVWLKGDSGTAQVGERELGGHPSGGNAMDPTFIRFKREFTVSDPSEKLVIDVSADERYYLTLDGKFVSRGPNRSTVENWQYDTYEIRLDKGSHVFEATVWKIGDKGPLAQLSWRGGFILKASGSYDRQLTTGVAKWTCGKLDGFSAAGIENGIFGTGHQWKIVGGGIIDKQPKAWSDAEVVRGFAGQKGPRIYGGRTNGWMLFPSQLPDQTETAVRPGRVVAASSEVQWRKPHDYVEAETENPYVKSFNDFLSGKTDRFVVPPKQRIQLAWDLGKYYCAYPMMTIAPAKSGRVSWNWTEATQKAGSNLKGSEENARDTIVGRHLNAYGDTFVPAQDRSAVFTTPWFRCGKWCRIDIETGDDPIAITDAHLVESRYPLEMESAFSSPEDPSLQPIRAICARAMQMCCHEMLYDCPYYEQQMYPGDTRVQLNVLTAMSRDDRIIKRAIELFDISARDDGQCPFNWPTRGTQEGATYTLCYLCMYGDYAMNHNDREWLKARLPGMRKTMSGMELYENANGLLENMPGWQFMDWVVGWASDGTAPGGRFGDGVNAEANLFWALAMKSAEKTERALGNELQARYWEEKRARLTAEIVKTFWCEERGLFADTPAKKDFSEHAQCLAILADVLSPEREKVCFDHLIRDPDLKRATVYFSYYLFESYFKFGRGDLFLKRLDLWRTYVKKGLTTTQEAPDSGKNGQRESRSDCHAWGAHPIWFMQTGLAGIRSDAPFFAKVRIAPAPGELKHIKASHPHPQGWIDVELSFENGKAVGTVETPVPGAFVFGGKEQALKAGKNVIGD